MPTGPQKMWYSILYKQWNTTEYGKRVDQNDGILHAAKLNISDMY
jgi:hypothetical protein